MKGEEMKGNERRGQKERKESEGGWGKRRDGYVEENRKEDVR